MGYASWIKFYLNLSQMVAHPLWKPIREASKKHHEIPNMNSLKNNLSPEFEHTTDRNTSSDDAPRIERVSKPSKCMLGDKW